MREHGVKLENKWGEATGELVTAPCHREGRADGRYSHLCPLWSGGQGAGGTFQLLASVLMASHMCYLNIDSIKISTIKNTLTSIRHVLSAQRPH